MKALYLVVVLAVLPACGNKNDVEQLHEEAVVVAKYYPAKLDAVDLRVQHIFKRGTTIPANLPGIEEVGKRLTEARDTIIQLRGIVAPDAQGKSAVEKQAEVAAKANKPDDLLKLIHDTETTMQNGLRVITEDLDAVESWIALYDQGLAKQVEGANPPPPAAPVSAGQASPPPSETAAPANPGQTPAGAPTAPNAGQPPAPTQPAGRP